MRVSFVRGVAIVLCAAVFGTLSMTPLVGLQPPVSHLDSNEGSRDRIVSVPRVPNHHSSPPPSLSMMPDAVSQCPPHRAGSRCERMAFPSCTSLWGFKLTKIAPCIEARHGSAVLPVSCECLSECEGSIAAARIDCLLGGNGTFQLSARYQERTVSLMEHSAPWKGHPQSLSRKWPELRIQYDPALVERLLVASQASREQKLCGGRGVHASTVKGDRTLIDSLNLKSESCSCIPGHSGDDCGEQVWHPSNCLNSCSGAGICEAGTCRCFQSARGIDCSETIPTACAKSRTGDGLRCAGANNEGGSSGHYHNGGDHGGIRHSSRSQRMGLSPRIYVYDLPARLTTWLALSHIKPPGCGLKENRLRLGPCWWQMTDPMYSADVQMLRRLLKSPHRTRDPAAADFFYVPLMLSLGFMTHRFGIYLPSSVSAQLIDEAITHISTMLPYWNRSNGADHILTFTGDDGSSWLRGRLPRLEHAIFLSHWGNQCNDAHLRRISARGASKCISQIGFRPHRAGQDIVMPPLHRPHVLLPRSLWVSPLLVSQRALRQPSSSLDLSSAVVLSESGVDELGTMRARMNGSMPYRYLLYFVGKVNRSAREGDIYSGGVRQRIFQAHAHRTDFYLRNRPGAKGGKEDADALSSSKFCLAPYGTGFGMREFDALVHGCVPLLVRVLWDDDPNQGGTIEQPFAQIIPWTAFALRLTRNQIPQLPELLAAVSPSQHAAMVRAGACVWPRMFWMPVLPDGLIATEQGSKSETSAMAPEGCGPGCRQELQRLESYDAFSTLLSVLMHRIRKGAAAHLTVNGASDAFDKAHEEAKRDVDEARRAEEASELEREWTKGTADLKTAPWITQSASCRLALMHEPSHV